MLAVRSSMCCPARVMKEAATYHALCCAAAAPSRFVQARCDLAARRGVTPLSRILDLGQAHPFHRDS
ncbi:hypothetical protein CEP54_005099 [Fusarium duplospermum]|uniref:Uncharacterized protein n=1 Tax=Fusarium duplospermum TaxID=1325734 RepID=A0A428QE75_9HYPO|nr:hypothetical protein CEP54_005099 [Fusarium duplospermum]